MLHYFSVFYYYSYIWHKCFQYKLVVYLEYYGLVLYYLNCNYL